MADYIDREAVIDNLELVDWYHVNRDGKLVSGAASDLDAFVRYDDAEKAIKAASPADVVPVVHGRWEVKYVEDAEPFQRRRFYCSACGDWTTYGETRCCPNCGARMDGEA